MKLPTSLPVSPAAILVIAAVLLVAGLFSCSRLQAWYYEGKAERRTEQRDQARAERDVARKDEAQLERSTDITADTVAAQDTHAAAERAATAEAVEVIHERIREVPVTVPVPDDPVVRHAVAGARARAETAARRLQRTPPD